MPYFTMSKLALKWALKKPVTQNYPFTPRQAIAGSRGQLEFSAATCTYCNVCAKKCPTNAIVVLRAQRRWTLDRLLCINCGSCVDICPKDCLLLNTGHGNPSITKDREIYQGEMPPTIVKMPAAAGATPAPVSAAPPAGKAPAAN